MSKIPLSKCFINSEVEEAALRALKGRLSTLEGTPPVPEERPYAPPDVVLAAAPSPEHAPAIDLSATPVTTMSEVPPDDGAAVPEPPAPRVLQPVTPTPRAPRFPRDSSLLWRWITGGNTLVRVGIVILFFGIAFLLKYAYEHTHVPIELRLTGVAVTAIVLLLIGWRLRLERPGYALALQGGGVGVLYLTVFAAFRLYQVLPPEAALALLFLIASLSAALAVMQDAQSLAALGASGGFLAPILASTGTGSHVMLFSYYVILNSGLLGIAWYKAWRPLNLLGFLFTFGIATVWGGRFYRPELFATTEPFLVIFFLFYLAIPILFARRRATELKNYVDGTLVFGMPLVAFGLQTQLVRNRIRRRLIADAERLSIASALALPASPGRAAHAGGGLSRAGSRVRHLGDSAGAGRPLDLRRLGARGRCHPVGRHTAGPLARARIRPVSATRRGHSLPDHGRPPAR
jgi:uncharacterized membrane protein